MKKINLHISLNTCKYASRILKISRSLIKYRIFDQIIILCLHKNQLPFEERINEKILIKRFKLYGVGSNIITYILKYIQLIILTINYVRKLRNIQVINAHSLEVLPLAVILKFITNAKLIYDTHELETEKTGLTAFRKKIAKILENFFIKFVDYVVVVNKSIEDEYRTRYPKLAKEEKIIAIYNVPPLVKVKPADIFRKKFNLSSQQKIFLYQGGFLYGRGIEKLLKVFSQLKDNKKVLVLIGYGPLEDLVKSYAKKYTNIFYHPAVNPDKLLEYTASADWGLVFFEKVSLNNFFATPNKFFEYLMAEIPVIVTPLKELRYFTEKYNVGIVASGESEIDLIEAIQKTDEVDVGLLKKNIQAFKKIYNWQNEEKKLLKIYKSLLK